ncbi:hypothetical protein PCL_07347 [Purpureocillium lilacinum]|uniref:Uncharacterized protein n=1 Tax=Purpureocillium lilacinum TaxID=33203 RepID=A0A2U3DSD0_PURLI|nr:hypothetical protein PCL_07347 [Purpureocillium lilacinum]
MLQASRGGRQRRRGCTQPWPGPGGHAIHGWVPYGTGQDCHARASDGGAGTESQPGAAPSAPWRQVEGSKTRMPLWTHIMRASACMRGVDACMRRAAQPSKTLGPSSSPPSPCYIASHNDDGASHPSLPRPESDEPLEAQTSAASAVAGSARRVAGTEPGLATDMATEKQEGRGMELTWHRRVKPKLQGRTAFAHMDEHV